MINLSYKCEEYLFREMCPFHICLRKTMQSSFYADQASQMWAGNTFIQNMPRVDIKNRNRGAADFFSSVLFSFLDPPVSVFLARPSFVFFAKQFAVRETSMTSQHHAMECKFWSLWEKNIVALSLSHSFHLSHLFFQLKTSTIKDPLLCTQFFYAANISNYSLANSPSKN